MLSGNPQVHTCTFSPIVSTREFQALQLVLLAAFGTVYYGPLPGLWFSKITVGM